MTSPSTKRPLVEAALPILINMPDRTDRFEDSMLELEALYGRRPVVGDDLEIVRPPRFTEAGGFINPAYRSCLHAHLEAAEIAIDRGSESALILEDDIRFEPGWYALGETAVERLLAEDWDIANIGYLGSVEANDPSGFEWERFRGEVIGCHAYLLRRHFLPTWIEHLHTIAAGTPGDDLQGPMGPDGALNTITWIEPSVTRLIARPSLIGQRPSRSDVNTRWTDKIPVARAALPVVRSLRVAAQRRRKSDN